MVLTRFGGCANDVRSLKMARKATPKSKPKAATAARGKDASIAEAPKKRAAPSKRSTAAAKPATSTRASAARSKQSPAKAAKPARKSVIGKAVEAVTSTVAGVAEGAASLVRRDRGKAKG